MSSFSVGSTGVSFDAIDMSYSDKGGALEEITCTLIIANPTDWGAMFSLRSWGVSQRMVQGGNSIVVDVAGGAGAGTLVLDGFDTHSAIMTALSRDFVEPGSLRSKAQATWLIVG